MSDHDDIYRILENLDAVQKGVRQLPALFKPANTSPQLDGPYPGKNATRGYLVGEEEEEDEDEDKEEVVEAATTEDVISTMKKKLGDYLQDVATAIKTDPDLKDKIPQDIDQIKAVKTIRTDDGHEIKIHGNEDDGFRISIKNKDVSTKFKNLDEATMACEMYCARRRNALLNADYIEEKKIMNLNELFEASIPSHIKPSDIPPAMRNRKLTMKDIEAERPKSAYRFRVGDKNFMDLGAAQDFAAGTGQKVERIAEEEQAIEKKSPKHSARVKRDGADEHIIQEKKDACYNKVRSRYKVWPSAYASGALVQCRKKGAANWGNKSK